MLFSVRCDGARSCLTKSSRKNSLGVSGSGSSLLVVTQLVCARTENCGFTYDPAGVLHGINTIQNNKIQQNNSRECRGLWINVHFQMSEF